MAELVATLVPLLGQALLHFLWQGALIGVLAALVLGALRDARPQARYLVACLALLACVLAPLATLLAPLLAPSLAPLGNATLQADGLAAAAESTGTWFDRVAPATRIDAYFPAIVATWAVGTCLLSLRMAFGLAWLRRLRQAPQGSAQAAWQARLDALAAHFQLNRFVELRLVDSLDTPVAAGWWRPVVLLPAGLLTRMPTDLIEALLAHELAHIRRHDYFVNLLQNAIEAVLFYHPVVWWLSHRIRSEREQIADQIASEVVCAPRRLALALSELSELQRTHPALHLVQAAHGGQLMSRIEKLLRPARRAHPGARIVFPLLGLVAAGIASFTYAQIGESERSTTITHGSLYLDGKRHGDTFALVRATGDEMNLWGEVDDIDEIKAARRGVDGEYLWFRRGGQAYIVTDPALLARAREATRESEALGKKMEALGNQMEPHGERMEALGEQMEALSEHMQPSPAMRAAERRMHKLGEQMEALGDKQSELGDRMGELAGSDSAQQDKLAREMDAMSKQMDELSRLMDEQSRVMDAEARRMDERREPMEALARQMEEESKPMDALGKQMEAQGRVLEEASKRAEQQMRRLIAESLERKLARPVSTHSAAR